MKLTTAQADRACGAVLGSAAGDALGAHYEFGTGEIGPEGPRMLGGGLGSFEPGEWTDDTAMAWCVLDAAASGADVRSEEALTQVARRFREWFDSHPPDIGNQTRAVVGEAGPAPTGAAMTATAYDLHVRTGRTAGNGSLMRTGPVALACLDDPAAVAEAARGLSALTHHDDRAQEACVLWSLAVRHAIVDGELDVRVGLEHLSAEAPAFWAARIDEAEASPPGRFRPNGWVVAALQAAWSAIHHTPIPAEAPERHLQDALATAIGIGDDTDTVAAIAGALLGARWGASAVPAEWREVLHGYPGVRGERLVELAHLTATGRLPEQSEDPFSVLDVALLILEAVGDLHARGHQRLRIVPGMSPSGIHWRATVAAVPRTTESRGHSSSQEHARVFRYTSGTELEVAGEPVDAATTPSEVADRILASVSDPGVARDPAYAEWYADLLALVRRHRTVPIAYADYFDDEPGWEIGWCTGRRFPAPPPPPAGG